MKKQIITAILAIALTSTIMAQEHQNKKHHGHGDGKPAHSANEYMHKASTDDLINRCNASSRPLSRSRSADSRCPSYHS